MLKLEQPIKVLTKGNLATETQNYDSKKFFFVHQHFKFQQGDEPMEDSLMLSNTLLAHSFRSDLTLQSLDSTVDWKFSILMTARQTTSFADKQTDFYNELDLDES